MLPKYQSLQRISKSPECSLYTATNREDGQAVLIKRLRRDVSWQELLGCKSMLEGQRNKKCAKMVEILRSHKNYFLVYERPRGPSFTRDNTLPLLHLQQFYPLFSSLCTALCELQQMFPGLYVRPQWIFLHRNSFRIVHFEPFVNFKYSSEHVYTYQLDKQQLNPESDKFFDKGNIVQQLGLIAGQLLTEEKWDQADIKLENANVAENIAKKVIDRSNDMPLTTLLREMLSSNPFTIPQLSEVASFMKARAEQHLRRQKPATITTETKPMEQESIGKKQTLGRVCCAVSSPKRQKSLQPVICSIPNRHKNCSQMPRNYKTIDSRSPVKRLSKNFLPEIDKRVQGRKQLIPMETRTYKPLRLLQCQRRLQTEP